MRRAACLAVTLVLGGCAAHSPQSAAQDLARFDRVARDAVEQSGDVATARPDASTRLEDRDPGLAAARLLVEASPTAAHHRQAAEAYARNGVLDAAYDHFSAAIRLQPHDAASLDGLARIWRDWGFPDRGLSYAYRAIYFAPASPVPQNTLGTLLVRMALLSGAHTAFERAVAFDPAATYARSNLCYTELLQGDRARAIADCREAVRIGPGMTAARNNLALAYAASGDFSAASVEFARAGSRAAERYNMGIALMAARHFDAAVQAFDEAAALHPFPVIARRRARQARALAAQPDALSGSSGQ